MKTCKDCGGEAPDRARFCPACGSAALMAKADPIEKQIEPQKGGKKTWVKYLTFILGAVIIIGIAVTVTILLVGRGGEDRAAEAESVEVGILSPEDNSTIYIDPDSQGAIDLDVEVACEGSPEKIAVYLDDQVKATLVKEPYNCKIRGIMEGSYIIRAEAKGDNEEILATANIKINIKNQEGEQEVEQSSQPSQPSNYSSFENQALTKYHNAKYSYTISYPEGWTREEEEMDYGYRAKWWSPDRSMYFLVDSSYLKVSEVNPCDTAYSLDREFIRVSTPGYVNYGITRETFKGWPSCRYELGYVSSENDFFPGQAIRKFDYFVIGNRNGYAVLFAARPDVYAANLQSFIETILNSLEPES